MKPRVVATVEARMTSSRLPGKVLMKAGGKPLLQILVERLQQAAGVDEVVVATTTNATDDPIVALADHLKVGSFRGSEHDVLARVCGALKAARADICVEITGDSPLVDPRIVEEVLAAYHATASQHPYVSNSDPHRSVPVGLDVQVMSASALQALADQTNDPADREHVSYGFYRPEAGNKWSPRYVQHESARGGENLLVTLDYLEDYTLIRAIHEALSPATPLYLAPQIIQWIHDNPELHEACVRRRAS
jgi:spore coat polysaccharide biosynthesis protein SpsF